MTETRPPPKPFLMEVDDEADPAAAPPVPESRRAPEARAVLAAARVASARPSGLWRFALWAFGALFTFWLSVSAYDFVTTLLAQSPILGLGRRRSCHPCHAGRAWPCLPRMGGLCPAGPPGQLSPAIAAKPLPPLTRPRPAA